MVYKRLPSSPSARLVVRDQNQIRQLLLRKLGIAAGHDTTKEATDLATIPSQQFEQSSNKKAKTENSNEPTYSLAVDECYYEPLKYDAVDETSESETNIVGFKDTVTVVEIPSHRDYDEETHRSLWSGSDEIHAQARRNRLEFMADNYNWRKAAEEKDMYDWNGELVHPATYWMEYQEQQERELLAEVERQYRYSSNTGNSPCCSTSMKRSPTMTSLQVSC